MQLNMLEAMNIYVNVVEQGSFIRAAEVLELHRPAVTDIYSSIGCAL
ncbi:LysR family transcriptional regulator, partial [Salmonella enterica]|nr:LysR family transcriptional regulator [Salmonella enterica]